MNMAKPLPPLVLLQELFEYDSNTGDLRWRVDRQGGGKKGSLAGGIDNQGYRRVAVDRVYYAAHRLIWKLHYGIDPTQTIDHINHDRVDNRITNLREATRQEQMRNRSASGLSELLGVSWHKQNRKWQAQITINGTQKYLGTFPSESEAGRAYNEAAAEHFGEFANLNELGDTP